MHHPRSTRVALGNSMIHACLLSSIFPMWPSPTHPTACVVLLYREDRGIEIGPIETAVHATGAESSMIRPVHLLLLSVLPAVLHAALVFDSPAYTALLPGLKKTLRTTTGASMSCALDLDYDDGETLATQHLLP